MTRAKAHLAVLAAFCLSCLLLAACSPKNPAEGAEVQKDVQFLDAFSFDRKLSASLAAGQDQVDVFFPANITLNNIPERMDKWLNMVEKFGGRVDIQAEPEGRGIITEIFSIFIKAYEAIEEKLIYSSAKDYNVLITYKAKTGIVTKFSFVRKPKPESKPVPGAKDAANATGVK